MILRAVFAFAVALMLVPHEPDLGLPKAPVPGQALTAVLHSVQMHLSMAARDLREQARLAALSDPNSP